MAIPTTRKLFKDYCLRRLGAPVIDINVDDGQVEDRIDDALAYYRDYHFDGTEHVYLSYKITQDDVTNKFITLPDDINYVIRIFDIGRASSVSNLFNIRYQIHLNDLFDFTSTTYVPYVMGMRHIEELEQIFVGSKPIRFNRHNNRLYVDMKWDKDVKLDDFVIVDCYRTLDSATYSDVWSDVWLKKYATALIKKQWGENLKKFEGMNLPGGVKFNGQKIWDEANEEINALEKEMNSGYSLPVMDMMN
jgi:hypothetical protein